MAKGKNGAPIALKKARSYAGTAAAGSRAKVPRESMGQATAAEQGEEADQKVERPISNSEHEQIPEDDAIPEIIADEDPYVGLDEQQATHSQESSAGQFDGDGLAPPLSTTSSSAAGTSVLNDPVTEPEETLEDDVPKEKVFTGFGPNRPYGKIGLPTEEATAEEAAARPSDEENKILPPTLRIKQPNDLQDLLNKESGDKEEFADKWGSRDGGSPLPLRSPGLTSVMSDDGGSQAMTDVNGAEKKSSEKKVPIWMRKGGEA